MERTIKLLYDPKDECYLVIYATINLCYCYKVDNVNPVMLSRIFEIGYNPYKKEKIIDEMGEFAHQEIKRLEGY